MEGFEAKINGIFNELSKWIFDGGYGWRIVWNNNRSLILIFKFAYKKFQNDKL